MPFKYTFRVEHEATTVPYAAVTDDIRYNRGFLDLRGRPDRAKEVAEGNASEVLPFGFPDGLSGVSRPLFSALMTVAIERSSPSSHTVARS